MGTQARTIRAQASDARCAAVAMCTSSEQDDLRPFMRVVERKVRLRGVGNDIACRVDSITGFCGAAVNAANASAPIELASQPVMYPVCSVP